MGGREGGGEREREGGNEEGREGGREGVSVLQSRVLYNLEIWVVLRVLCNL